MKNEKLHTIKNSGFKVPQDYFEGIEDAILNEAKLKSIVSDSGLNVPESYFENLEASILDKALVKNETKVISLFSKRNLIYLSGIAAAVLLLFNLSIFNSVVTFDSLDAELVENYFDENNLNSLEIASLFEDTELENIDTNFITLEDESLEDYLLENSTLDDLISLEQ